MFSLWLPDTWKYFLIHIFPPQQLYVNSEVEDIGFYHSTLFHLPGFTQMFFKDNSLHPHFVLWSSLKGRDSDTNPLYVNRYCWNLRSWNTTALIMSSLPTYLCDGLSLSLYPISRIHNSQDYSTSPLIIRGQDKLTRVGMEIWAYKSSKLDFQSCFLMCKWGSRV